MLKNIKIYVFILILVTAFIKISYADEFFFRINSDLENIGQSAFSKINSAPFKGEIYRLPNDFKLGIGDTLVIELWGKLEDKYSLSIDRDGKILIPRVGSVYIIGLTIEEAKKKIGDTLNRKYANVQFDVSLGNVQDIRITVLGNVNKPGIFAISPFAKILDAIIAAGGTPKDGSLRKIKLIRNNEVVEFFDFYKFVFKGDESKNVSLTHGDKIFVPLFENLAAIRGDVVRPGIYELDRDAVLSDLIDIASGILESKFNRKIQVIRLDKETKNIIVYKEIIFDNFSKIKGTKDDIKLSYQDIVIVTTEHDFTPFTKEVFKVFNLDGEVKNPGKYYIQQGDKLSVLINRAGGLTDFAYPEGAVFIRQGIQQKQKEILDNIVKARERDILDEEDKLSTRTMSIEEKELWQRAIERKRKSLSLFASKESKGRIIIDLPKVLKGEEDVVLEKGDSLYIPPIPNYVLVNGAVYNPESVLFKSGEDIKYYLEKVGGTTERANVDGIYIIKVNGVVKTKLTGYGTLSPGDVIVVLEKDTISEEKSK